MARERRAIEDRQVRRLPAQAARRGQGSEADHGVARAIEEHRVDVDRGFEAGGPTVEKRAVVARVVADHVARLVESAAQGDRCRNREQEVVRRRDVERVDADVGR